jgi:uncharacterized membrane protein YdbT with pleckstrin-like domain
LSYVDSNLIAGEKVAYKTGLHWIVLFWPVVLGALFGLLGLLLLISIIGNKRHSPGIMVVGSLVLLIVAAVCILYGYLVRAAIEIAVTNKRVIVKTGVVRRRTIELLLSKVESIGVDETLPGRMLGYGTVVVHGTGGTPEPFDKVSHPLEFRRQVQEQIELSQQGFAAAARNS